jgi:copper homeostasis protein (lipoprotein)
MKKTFVPAYKLAAAFFTILVLMVSGCSTEQATKPSKPVVSRTPLLNTTWRTIEINGAKAEFLPGQKLDITLMLSKGGRFSGSTGCNHLSGSYTLGEGRLSFGSLLITRLACPAQLMSREKVLLGAIRQVSGYAIRGNRLKLFNAREEKVMELIALGTR